MSRTLVPITEITPPKATLTTACSGSNNDLKFTARRGGPWGNNIEVAYIVSGASTPLSVVVAGFLITVNVATTSGSAAASTASEILAAIEASPDAAALVEVELKSGDTGAGVVAAFSAAALTGGQYGTTLPSAVNGDATNGHYITGNDGQVVIKVISSDAGSQTVTIHYSARAMIGLDIDPIVETIGAGATVELGPFDMNEFNQNAAKDVYFDPSVGGTLDFVAYRATRRTT